jgi:hypothetical protein
MIMMSDTREENLGEHQMEQHQFVFVCGLHRSGTSVLFRSLRGHPLMSGFEDTNSPENEGMHLQTVYKPSGFYGGAGKFGFSPEAHLTETSELVSEANQQKLFDEWKPYWELNKPFLLEKSPPNLIRTRFLQAMFPNSHFVILMRHPVAVSLATRAWYRRRRFNRRRLDRLVEHWVTCHEIFEADSQHLRNVTIIHYEHFVQQPQIHLDRIYAMLGVPTQSINETIRTAINDKYFGQWQTLAASGISKYIIQTAVRRFEDRVNHFGYSLVNLEQVTPFDLEPIAR